MLVRSLTLLATCVVACTLIAPLASADPQAEPDRRCRVAAEAAAAAAARGGRRAGDRESRRTSPPATTKSPDGWTLNVSAKDETQMVIQPLTTAISTRNTRSAALFNASMDRARRGRTATGHAGSRLPDRLRHRHEHVERCGDERQPGIRLRASASVGLGGGRRDNGYPDCSRRPSVGQARGGAEARHHQRHPGHEETVRRRRAVGADHRIPHQDRRVRRRVVYPLVCVLDQVDQNLRRDRQLLRRDEEGLSGSPTGTA